MTKIVSDVLEKNGIPGAVASLVTGGKQAGEAIVESRDVELGDALQSSTARSEIHASFSVFHWE